MSLAPFYPLHRVALFSLGLIIICHGCSDDLTDPSGGGDGQETIPPLAGFEVAAFQVEFGPAGTNQLLPDRAEKLVWDPGREPISPVIGGLRVEVRDVDEAIAPASRVRTLTGSWRLTDVAGQIRYLPRCQVDSLSPGASVTLEEDFLALLPDSSTAWRPWQIEGPPGEDLAFTLQVSWAQTVVAYHISADTVFNKAQVYLTDPTGSRHRQLTFDNSENTSPQVSPDGTKILFVSTRSSFLRQPQFWTLNVDGTGLYRVIFNFTSNINPRWSPDGTQIVFQMMVQEKWHIYLMNADGLNEADLSGELGGDFSPAFSADGTKIIFRSNRQGPGLYIMNLDGSNKRKWLDYPVFDAVWSPDGERLAYRAGEDDLYVYGVDGRGLRNLTPHTAGVSFQRPAWSPDGYRLLCEGLHTDGRVEIYRINRDGTDLIRVVPGDSVSCHSPNWGPGF